MSKNTRNQNVCDVCRSRRVKCRFSDGEACDGCKFLRAPCTANRPRRKRGPPNRHAFEESSGIELPQLSPATAPFSPSSDSGRSSATILSQLAASPLINIALDDWFTHVHPLAPVLHQGHSFRRLADSGSNDLVITGLVISVLAATAAALRRKAFTEYRPITPDRSGPYSLDWCIAKYNLATASMAQRGLGAPLAYRMIGESDTGTSYLLSNELQETGLLHQELLKRLWCLLEITLIPAYIPQPYADDDLYADPSAAVPPLRACSGSRRYPEYSRYSAPPLRWRGGLSRPATATPRHDVQIANIFITSLFVRSNLLQQFAPSTAPEYQEEHQRIVSDLLEVLNHLPREILEANGYRLIPEIRDIGGAYLEVLRVHADMAGELVVIGD
ncbi:Zn(II)2Cys6 transcription factor domain-containing protein [Aspergillus foveolatus]|uniref:Zn(II)2Cys6 transcription factor domain-containing protein n=1 Tax=Aspergillus foveolatus TaxID=210207 RepID=UPI003CCE2150